MAMIGKRGRMKSVRKSVKGRPPVDGFKGKAKSSTNSGEGPSWKPAKGSTTGKNYGQAVSAAAKAKSRPAAPSGGGTAVGVKPTMPGGRLVSIGARPADKVAPAIGSKPRMKAVAAEPATNKRPSGSSGYKSSSRRPS